MSEKIHLLWPEIVLFVGACVVMVAGLSPRAATRRMCAVISGMALLGAGVLAWMTTPRTGTELPNLALAGKVLTAGVGVLLLLVLWGTSEDAQEASGLDRGSGGEGRFDPGRWFVGEFHAFFLFSLTGLMLCAGADDLIWLFLALELTSLPTYVMVAVSTARTRSLEAGVKYFFLGALGAATFLYGFALLYGATGSTNLAQIAAAVREQTAGGVQPGAILTAGLVVSALGVCFKIAAVPMHFYTPDVYQGAAPQVSAFLAFVPKTAGFFTLMLLCSAAGWRFGSNGTNLPDALHAVLWVVAVATMTVGNVLAILQSSIKRILAYSSIAHSGYMLVGLIAGPGYPGEGFSRNGLAAVFFYLISYGVINLGAFAVLASLERLRADGSRDEIEGVEEVRGLCRTHPVLGWTLVLSSVGLLGLPPLLGFFAKLPLFTAGLSAGHVTLVVILGLNSAAAAFYYLRIASAALLEEPLAASARVRPTPYPARVMAALISAAGVVVLVAPLGMLSSASSHAASIAGPVPPPRPEDPRLRNNGAEFPVEQQSAADAEPGAGS